MKKNFFRTLAALVMLAAMAGLMTACTIDDNPVIPQPDEDEPGWKGSGTADNPYIVRSKSDLSDLADSVNSGITHEGQYFKMTANIDLENISWTPIGSYAKYFLGTFDGNGKTISNLKIDEPAYTSGCGLFGAVGIGGIVKDLTVSGKVMMQGGNRNSSNVGGIVGRLYCGTIQNCVNNCDVTAGRQVGGIVGLQTGSVINCTNNGTVTATFAYAEGDACAVGGIAGVMADDGYKTNPDKHISGCINNGAVNGSTIGFYVGGIVGDVNNYHGSRSTLSVIDCQNKGVITGYRKGIAGCVGFVRQASKSANITGNHNNGKIYAKTIDNITPTNIGVVVGNDKGVQSGNSFGPNTAIYIDDIEQPLSQYTSELAQ